MSRPRDLERTQRAVQFLDHHGAATIEHPGGTLLAHLMRTQAKLIEWNRDDALARAGLCHAVYGTDGFRRSLIDTSARVELVELIGADAERIVYFYASCDRGFFYPQVGVTPEPTFRDRFTGQEFSPSAEQLREFWELSFANELDIVRVSPEFAADFGPSFAELFDRAEAFVSSVAFAEFRSLLPNMRA